MENPDSTLHVLQWVMIYSFRINTDLRIDPKLIPHTDIAECYAFVFVPYCLVMNTKDLYLLIMKSGGFH